MSNEKNIGDFVIVKKYGYGIHGTYGIELFDREPSTDIELERGLVYVFYPPNNDFPFVKRLIGMPGDSINVLGSIIIVNKLPLKTSIFFEDNIETIYQEELGDTTYKIKRMPTRPFEMYIDIIVPEDSYFFLGDNRDNSLDSRTFGTIPKNQIIGEVVYVIKRPKK